MKFHDQCVLAGWLLVAAQAAAQTVPTIPVPAPVAAYQTAVSTAMVGFTASQTVQLNVLNLTAAATTATATPANPVAACEVQLAFYDGQNRLLKQGTVTGIGPGAAASLSLGRGDFPAASATAQRVSIRGQVNTVAAPVASLGASGPAVIVSGCSPVVSLEVYDNVTGATQVFTTDARVVWTGGAVPLAVGVQADR